MNELEGISILLVEDDELIQEMYRRQLENKGATVHVSGTQEDTMAVLEKSPPHVILLDRAMSPIDGLEIATGIRANGEYNRIPIIMLTNLSLKSEDEGDEIADIGVNKYLVKADTSSAQLTEAILQFAR